MFLEETVRNLPILTAVLLYAIVAVQIWRDRIRTWTETFFVAGFFFLATYALSDFLYFHSPSEQATLLASRIADSSLTLSATFFFLFTAVFLGNMKRKYAWLLIPNALSLAAVWGPLVQGAERVSWGWQTTYDNTVFGLWVLFIAVCVLGNVRNLLKTYKIVNAQSRSLGVRTLALAVAFAFGLAVAMVTNVLFGVWNIRAMPIFSSALIAVGVTTLFIVLPITWENWTNAMTKWGSRRYEVKGAYLVFEDGTLIGSKSIFRESSVDLDIFSATLDVIQNFMRTSFPIFSGNWLKTIEHGEMRIVIERGQQVYLALVITGHENDLLRRQMKDMLKAFESRNVARLTNWRGMAQDAQGTDQALSHFFAKEALF